MPKLLTLRALTTEEEEPIGRLARSRTDPARSVERARILQRAHQGQRGPAIARELGIGVATVRRWVRRFNAVGLAGLTDAGHPGRPPTSPPEQIGTVIETSLTPPQDLDLPFASWTLDRLAVYLDEHRNIPIKRSRIGELLQTEGVRWRTQETWFGERIAPAFEKRGPSSHCIPRRPPGVS